MKQKTIITTTLLLCTGLFLNVYQPTARLPDSSLSTTCTYNVTASVYHAVPEQTNDDHTRTASMFKINTDNPYSHRIIAVSRDLLSQFPFGTKVKVSGTGHYDGIYEVQDKMPKRWSNKIDLLINVGMREGLYKNVTICKV